MASDPWLRVRGLPIPFSPQAGMRLLEALLVAALGVSLAGLTWDLVPAPEGGSSRAGRSELPASASRNAGNATPSSKDLRVSEAVKQLFGSPPSDKGSTQAEPEEPVRETRLNLTLKGILAKGQGPRLAIIADSGKEQKVYRIGDRVPGGAEILRIEPRRVILRHNGVTEALKLEVQELKGRGVRSAGGRSPAGGIRRVSATRRQVDSSLVQAKLKDLPGLLRQAKAVPHTENGENVGFRIVNIQSGSIYEDLGLKEGDVIKKVNGRSIRSPSQAMKAYRELQNSNHFKVQVVREGKPVTLNFSVR